MMQTLPSHPPLSCKNERKLCNQVSGVLLTYLLLMNLTVIAAMLVEAGLRLIHLGTLGYGLNAALHRVMQPDYLTQLLQSGTGYLVVSGLCLLLILLWKGRSFYRDVFRPGWPMSGPVFWQLLSVFMAIQVLSSVFKENHLHSHFVVNTVSFVDGIKYHRTAKDYHDMQAASDALCREYGLSVIKNPGQGRSKHYGEWRAEQEGRPTWRGIIRTEIDEIIRQSMTERQFFENLRRRGYEVKAGKDISVRPPRKERFVRLERNFSPAYSIEGIRARILSQRSPERPMPEPPAKLRYARYKGSFRAVPRATGFRALYFHYCYLLGIFPKNRPKSNKRLHFLLREDLIKLDAISEEMKLLAGHRIDTGEQLFSYQDSLTGKIEALTADRKELYRKQRTVAVKSDDTGLAEVKASIAALSKELAALRREVKLCDDIAARSGVMREKIKAVREDAKSQGKEKKRDEQFRRRG